MPRRKRLDPAILEAALAGLEAQRQRIDEQIVQLRAVLGGERSRTGGERTTGKGRQISAAGRRRIAAAQRKRWAQLKQAKAHETKPRRRLSAVGRKRIARTRAASTAPS
jgi:hypothetical protein